MQPFRPKEAVNPGYVNAVDQGSYAGLADSALMCKHPDSFSQYFLDNKNKDNGCPESSLPFSYTAWSSKWYSPVCRGWYKDSKKAGNKGIISDPYMMA